VIFVVVVEGSQFHDGSSLSLELSDESSLRGRDICGFTSFHMLRSQPVSCDFTATPAYGAGYGGERRQLLVEFTAVHGCGS